MLPEEPACPYPLNRRGLRSRILALVHAALLITLHHIVTQPLFAQTTFGPQQVITTAAEHPNSVYAADLDSDGDIDVLSASAGDEKIAWYENTDGAGGSIFLEEPCRLYAGSFLSITLLTYGIPIMEQLLFSTYPIYRSARIRDH